MHATTRHLASAICTLSGSTKNAVHDRNGATTKEQKLKTAPRKRPQILSDAERCKRSRLASIDSVLMSSSGSSSHDSDIELDVLSSALLGSDDSDSCPSVHGEDTPLLESEWAMLGGDFGLAMPVEDGPARAEDELMAALARPRWSSFGLEGEGWEAGVLQLL